MSLTFRYTACSFFHWSEMGLWCYQLRDGFCLIYGAILLFSLFFFSFEGKKKASNSKPSFSYTASLLTVFLELWFLLSSFGWFWILEWSSPAPIGTNELVAVHDLFRNLSSFLWDFLINTAVNRPLVFLMWILAVNWFLD